MGCLKCLSMASPHSVYWSYIVGYAEQLYLATESQEDLVVARLACLMRARSRDDCELLRKSWGRLNHRSQHILTEHFLADGIMQQAFTLMFLPDYIANARGNPVVGLHRALVVLVDLLEALQATCQE